MSVKQQAQWQGPESGNGMQPLLMLIIELCVSCYDMSKCLPWKGTLTKFRSLCLSERKSFLTSALIWPSATRAIVDMFELPCGWHGYAMIGIRFPGKYRYMLLHCWPPCYRVKVIWNQFVSMMHAPVSDMISHCSPYSTILLLWRSSQLLDQQL